MAQYIPLDAVVAEINKRLHQLTDAAFDSMIGKNLIEIRDSLDTLEVKEVDLDAEIVKYEESFKHNPASMGYKETAKHFFELGMRVNNPITAADRGTAEEIIINLKRVEQDYRINLTKEIEWIMNKVQKEPVSESLEKAATKYAQDKYMPVQTSQAFKAGANWQKEQFEKNLLAAYNKAIKDARKWLEGGNIFRYLDYDKEAGMVYMTGNLYEDLEKELTITKKVEDLTTK